MSAATFSYAQAARGQTAAQPSPQQNPSPAPSTTGSQGKDDASTGATSITAPSVASSAPETQYTEQKNANHAGPVTSKEESQASSIASMDSTTATVTEPSGKIPQENGTKAADVPTRSRSEDKGSRSTSRTSRVNDNAEGRRGRKGKKGRGGDEKAQGEQNQEEDAEKVKEPAKPVILTEAPPPAVNPWAKRMEAQNASVKAKQPSPEGPAVSNEVKQNPSHEDSLVHSTVPNGESAPHKKPVEASRPTEQASRRTGPRGSRAGDKDEKNSASLPPVADPSSWPDPRSAAAREQASRKPQEKTDQPEKEGQDESGPTRKKTWEKLEIVHSVVFETQLPPLRGSKPRGGARGGREAGPMRGNHSGGVGAANSASQPAASSASDKAPSPGGSTGPRTATTRPREGSIPARSTSQPHASQTSKRTSVDGASRDQRKSSVHGNTEQARDVNADAPFSSKRASATRDIRMENGQLSTELGQASGRALPQDRNTVQHRGDYAKDGAQGQQFSVREGRPERGRGGGYRSRGGHSASSSHLGSASYAPNGHYSASGGFPPRQNPSAHSPPAFSTQFPATFGHPTRGRGNKWANSGQSAARGNTGATGFPPKAVPVNDYAMPQYPPYMYATIYDPSVTILKTQVEYYLSVENLCKDYYLRQHMDGQGFAHLSTIAGFKRIKTVTEDLDLIRLACSLSDQIEFVIGDDNIERLRLREQWKYFVLPVNERLEPFRNDGPANWTPYTRPDAQFAAPFPVAPIVPQPYPPAVNGAFPAFADEQMFQSAYVNGAAYIPAANGGAVNGHPHGHESQLSAGVPEYAPPQSPVTLESMTNFSDSQVENLMMIVSHEEKDEAGSSEGAGVAGYVSEQPQATQNAAPPSSAEIQSLPGAPAGSEASSAGQTERGIVWVDGQAAAFAKEQTDRRPYTEIRKAALDERQNAKAGETPKSMQKLYKFWSRMLLNDFNAKVYQEFRDLALEDASKESPVKVGLKYLLEFYDGLLLHTNTRKPWPRDRAVPEIFTAHFNEAAELDRTLSGKDATTA